MNSFEMDMRRAILSRGFMAGLLLELCILFGAGLKSDVFLMSVPVLCALPYSTAWLADYQSGFIKAYLPRTCVTAYILGKILACGISGGVLEVFGIWIYIWVRKNTAIQWSPPLIFMSGMLWAVVAALLAAASNSRAIAYGGGFVLYYILVILHERYFDALYCLYPYEWLWPEHVWIFGEWGVIFLEAGILFVLLCLYAVILRRCIEDV
jgi:drug/metabolite transporter superfamily protein YnfA